MQIVLQKLSECDTNVLPTENIAYDDDDDTVVTPVQSTNSLQKKEVCLMRYHIFHSKSCHIFGIPKTTISFKKNFVLVLEKIGSME